MNLHSSKNILIIILLFQIQIIFGNPFSVKSFSKNDYKAANQNWSVCTSKDGFVYFANNVGLLEFDGVFWTLYPSPNGSIIRSVAIDSSGRIHTGGYREFGYWVKTSKNTLKYHSLSDSIKHMFSRNEEFWNILIHNQSVVYHSFSGIYIYNGQEINKIESNGFLNYSVKLGTDLFFMQQNGGILKLDQGILSEYFMDEFFNGRSIRFMHQYSENELLIGTELSGLFLINLNSREIIPWASDLQKALSHNKINKAVALSNGNILIGTISDGIYMVNPIGELLWSTNTLVELQSNTVLGICEDRFNNIWLALDKGINYLALDIASTLQFERNDNIGSVYSIALYKDNLYAGTNQGLYVKEKNSNNCDLVENSLDQVWDCKVFDDELIIGHNSGTYKLSNRKLEKISNFSGGYSIINIPYKPDKLIQSTYSNLVVYSAKPNQVILSHPVKGFNNLIRFIEFDHMNNLWASHLYKGLYKIRLSDDLDTAISVTNYIDRTAFKNINNTVNVFKVENRVVFTTKNQIFTYDDINDSILSYDFLNNSLGIYKASNRIVSGSNNHYWFISSGGVACFKISGKQCKLIKEFPSNLFNNSLIENYENITPVSDTQAYLCLDNGYVLLTATSNSDHNFIRSAKFKLREFKVHNNSGKQFEYNPSKTNLKIPYNKNNFTISYAFPLFTTYAIKYQFYLEGLYNSWSEKLDKPVIDANRIPPGNYTLKVRAIDEWGNYSETHQTSFKINHPIYRSWYAFIAYIFIIASLIYIYRRSTIKKIRLVELRKRREKERELIQLKNEKLQAELSFKSQQLASTTMGIIKKNEFLMTLKEKIKRQKEELGTRYPEKYYLRVIRSIDEDISDKDYWKLFEANFEQAHESFMLNLKRKFPELTPSDLRLCAYLRINLTSKDIAPLLGITIRGVENHRYRLRKKLALSPDQSLADFILSFKR